MHTSVKLNTPCELINVTPLNPLISKCQIKVCYVGDEPNRNGSVITKEVAARMANSLPGSPIVGFWKEEEKDFDEHNRVINISGGKWEVADTTRPYGFVDMGAKVWFQDYLDNDETVHTYLVTEGYIWTGQYPEASRIITKGNNQSMELDDESMKGNWTIDDKTGMEFFIINDAIISKLCILGENVEPCFEGAQITSTFSLDESFDSKIYKLMKEVQKIKGGNFTVEKEVQEEVVDTVIDPVEEVETEAPADPVEEAPAVEEESVEIEEPAAEEEPAEESAAGEQEEAQEPDSEQEEEPAEENLENEDEEVKFSLTDFQNLQESLTELQTKFDALQTQYDSMKNSYDALVEFKNTKDREEKQAMIDKFYMLSDEDKKDVQENIDSYSLDEIEAKLCVICVHNNLDMSGNTEAKNDLGTTFNLENVDDDSEDDNIPALVSALRKNRKNEN